MAKDDPHFRLRIPPDLKVEIEQAALDSKRSINAEIVERLERTFVEDFVPEREQLLRKIEASEARAGAFLDVIKALTGILVETTGRDPTLMKMLADAIRALDDDPARMEALASKLGNPASKSS